MACRLGMRGPLLFPGGSHIPARHPILVPTERRAGFSLHRGCGLCLLCGEPLPVAQSRIDSRRAGGGEEREHSREEWRRGIERERESESERARRSDPDGTAPALPSPLITIRKRDPRPAGTAWEPGLGEGRAPLAFFQPFGFCTLTPLSLPTKN